MPQFTTEYGTTFQYDDNNNTVLRIIYDGNSLDVPTSDIIEAVRDKISRPNILDWLETMVPGVGPPQFP